MTLKVSDSIDRGGMCIRQWHRYHRVLGSNPTVDKIAFNLKFSFALRSLQLIQVHTNTSEVKGA